MSENENALDRLFKEQEREQHPQAPMYDLDEQIEALTSANDDAFVNTMSTQASEVLKQRVAPEPVQPVQLEPQKPVAEKVVEPKVRKPKAARIKREKSSTATMVNEFMDNLANECIDIMIQSGVTVHGFSEDQMSVIWDYIREKMR